MTPYASVAHRYGCRVGVADVSKTIAIHAQGPLDKFEATASEMVNILGNKLGITFQRFDLRDVKDLAELEDRAKTYGWEAELEKHH